MVTTRQTGGSVAVSHAPATKAATPVKASATTVTKPGKRVIPRPPVRPNRIQKFAVKASASTKFGKKNSNPDESVEVVKMLTGILYLYRGADYRRAEFVRKV